ncbi:unnamed protein product [Symbiodinium sp. CCMP2592]|nr:unnamed protein product [Symbiodinium sp. CCMP2592]CAE7274694.1 unnamed protein product [Symbiodinium sp. CCMP2592]
MMQPGIIFVSEDAEVDWAPPRLSPGGGLPRAGLLGDGVASQLVPSRVLPGAMAQPVGLGASGGLPRAGLLGDGVASQLLPSRVLPGAMAQPVGVGALWGGRSRSPARTADGDSLPYLFPETSDSIVTPVKPIQRRQPFSPSALPEESEDSQTPLARDSLNRSAEHLDLPSLANDKSGASGPVSQDNENTQYYGDGEDRIFATVRVDLRSPETSKKSEKVALENSEEKAIGANDPEIDDLASFAQDESGASGPVSQDLAIHAEKAIGANDPESDGLASFAQDESTFEGPAFASLATVAEHPQSDGLASVAEDSDNTTTELDLRPSMLVFPSKSSDSLGDYGDYHGLAAEDEHGVLQAIPGDLPGTVKEPAAPSDAAQPEAMPGQAELADPPSHDSKSLAPEPPSKKAKGLSAEAKFLASATAAELKELDETYPTGSRVTPEMSPGKVLKLKSLRVYRKRQLSVDWHKNFQSKGVPKATAETEALEAPPAEKLGATAKSKASAKSSAPPAKKLGATAKSKASAKSSAKAKAKMASAKEDESAAAGNLRAAKDPEYCLLFL